MENLDWCFKQKKGIRIVEPNINLSLVYLRKSKSSLNMLNSAIEKEEWDWVLETSYYARYFCIYAFLMKIGIKCEIHDCTISFIDFLEREGYFGKEIVEELSEARNLRVNALYYNKDFSYDLILKFAKSAPDFCLKIEEFIEKLSTSEIKKIRGLL